MFGKQTNKAHMLSHWRKNTRSMANYLIQEDESGGFMFHTSCGMEVAGSHREAVKNEIAFLESTYKRPVEVEI